MVPLTVFDAFRTNHGQLAMVGVTREDSEHFAAARGGGGKNAPETQCARGVSNELARLKWAF
jgi:hypothetical protein